MSEVYAFKNIEEEVKRSSSGGAFIALCYAFEKIHGVGSVVFCGATFDDSMQVKHIVVENADECRAFQGS